MVLPVPPPRDPLSNCRRPVLPIRLLTVTVIAVFWFRAICAVILLWTRLRYKYTHMTHYTFLKASPGIERRELRALRFIFAGGLMCLLVLITA